MVQPERRPPKQSELTCTFKFICKLTRDGVRAELLMRHFLSILCGVGVFFCSSKCVKKTIYVCSCVHTLSFVCMVDKCACVHRLPAVPVKKMLQWSTGNAEKQREEFPRGISLLTLSLSEISVGFSQPNVHVLNIRRLINNSIDTGVFL